MYTHIHMYTLAHIDIICAYRYMDATILHLISHCRYVLTNKKIFFSF